MSLHDLKSQRLFITGSLQAGTSVVLERDGVNYLKNVLRMSPGDEILLFNGRDGEWRARILELGRRRAVLEPLEMTRAQDSGPDIDYLFAPLKRARLDYMVQKATELGVRRLRPVLTRRSIADRVNLRRMHANAVEAAEQCGILHIPDVEEPVKLAQLLAKWDERRRIIFCDEAAGQGDPIATLQGLPSVSQQPVALALLIGPEGGFSPAERALLRGKSFVTAIFLGPRIMRADTAAVAALALVNAVVGDWRGG